MRLSFLNMKEQVSQDAHSKWHVLSFLGLDAAIVALMWAQCYVELLDIPVVTEEPFLFVAISVWLSIILVRLLRAILNRSFPTSDFYVNQMGLIAVVTLGVLMAFLWICFYYVSVHFMTFITLPLIFFLLANFPLFRRLEFVCMLLRSFSFSLLCIAPALYFMVTESPLDALYYPPVYYLALLIFLFELTRVSIMTQDKVLSARYGMITTIGLIFLLVVCLNSAHAGMLYERGLYYSFILGCAVLELISRLRTHLSAKTIYAYSWLFFAIAPLLAIYLF